MAKLTDLPVEVLQIISMAEEDSSSERILKDWDLASLSRVNRWFHEVANYFLYSYKKSRFFEPAMTAAIERGNFETLELATSFGREPESLTQLFVNACTYGKEKIVKWVMERDVAIEETFPEPGTSQFRFELGYPSIRLWTDTNKDSDFKEVIREGYPTLLHSINHDMEDVALFLLSRGASPDFSLGISGQRSALHYAACRNMIRVVEYLVQQSGLPIDLLDYESYTPLRYTMRFSRVPDKDTRMIKKLIELGADVNSEVSGELPLISALCRGRFQQAQALLDAGSKIKADNPGEESRSAIRALIHTRYNSRLAFRGPRQWPMLRRLIKAGVDLMEPNEAGNTALEEAILNGSPQMVSQLLTIITKKYGKKSVDQQDLLYLMATNYEDIPLFLRKAVIILKSGGRMDTPLFDGYTFLSWLFFDRENHEKEIKEMFKIATKSMLDRRYLSVLLKELTVDSPYLTWYASASHLKILMKNGAKLKTKDIVSAAFRCLSAQDLKSTWLTTILDMGFPTKKLPSLVTSAIRKTSKADIIELLLDRVGANIWHRYPKWLHKATEVGHDWVVDKLLKGPGNVDVVNVISNGQTLLHRAIGSESPAYSKGKVVSVLTKHGADPFLPTRHSVCHRKKHATATHENETLSAFELTLHKGLDGCAEEMWKSATPETRPDPRTFFECTPDPAEWCRWKYKDSTVEEWFGKLTGVEDQMVQGEEAD